MASPQSKMWSDAIKVELKALDKKNTWTAVKTSPKKKVIGTKWGFAINRNEHGDIERYKARLVAWVIVKPMELIITKHIRRLRI